MKINENVTTKKVSLRRRALYVTGAVVLAAALFYAPRTAGAACVVASPTMCSGGMCVGVALNTGVLAEPFGVMSPMDALCSPPAGVVSSGMTVVFMATATGPSPFCAWDCGALTPAFFMDASDGLPVELMSFGIE